MRNCAVERLMSGLELLSTVHWVATHDEGTTSAAEAHQAIGQRNARKKQLMQVPHVEAAWVRMMTTGWLVGRVQ